jgi:hypothetical protein
MRVQLHLLFLHSDHTRSHFDQKKPSKQRKTSLDCSRFLQINNLDDTGVHLTFLAKNHFATFTKKEVVICAERRLFFKAIFVLLKFSGSKISFL